MSLAAGRPLTFLDILLAIVAFGVWMASRDTASPTLAAARCHACTAVSAGDEGAGRVPAALEDT